MGLLKTVLLVKTILVMQGQFFQQTTVNRITLFVCLSVYLSVYLSVCLSVYLSIYLCNT
jgi:hypothetical protein